VNGRRLAGTTVGALVIGGATAAAVGFGGTGPGATAQDSPLPGTTPVTRTTLTRTEEVSGVLGYGEPGTLTGRIGGTVTWLPAAGQAVERGGTLYRVDDRPVPLLYGGLPMYRTLRSGVEGTDVRQFEENLRALGRTGFTVDDEYTSATAEVVRDWQADLGLAETGTVEVGQLAYAGGPVRIGEVKAAVGDPATGPLLSWSGTTRVVGIDLPVSQQTLVARGTAATVELPDGGTVTGEVSSVGTVAAAAQADQEATIEVTVSIADQAALGTLDQAPVTVTLVAQRRPDVLTVPVAALLALAEGGYGVEVVEGGSGRVVAVQVGLFAGGRVEISGAGIDAGTTVGVAS